MCPCLLDKNQPTHHAPCWKHFVPSPYPSSPPFKSVILPHPQTSIGPAESLRASEAS